MRRIVSVFASKRERSDPSPAATTSHSSSATTPTSLSFRKSLKRVRTVNVTTSPVLTVLADSTPSTPQLSVGSSEPSSQSSASSSGSADLRTPEDDHAQLDHTTSTSKSSQTWISWLGKRSGTIKRPTANSSNPPPVARSAAVQPVHHPADETEDESPSESEDDDDLSLSHTSPRRPRQPTTQSSIIPSISQAKQTLEVIIQNSLSHRSSPSPFLQLPTGPLYPRSCNPSHTLTFADTLSSTMYKRRLLRRLHDPSAQPEAEQESILPFSLKSSPSLVPPEPELVDDVLPARSCQVSEFSAGIGRWISRPCFEDRYCVYLAMDETIARQKVTGTRFGVAALEYSEALEAMVDFGGHPSPLIVPEGASPSLTPEPETSPSPSSSSSNLSLPQSRPSHPVAPSPLRREHHPASNVPGQLNDAAETASPPPAKRGVRFADDDKEDTIPIGYILRLKKQREQKAKFLQEQKERRAFDEERRAIELERRKREQERLEWEREKQAWEKEKRAMEEEKKRSLYAEEIAATRLRRESQRAGGRGTIESSSSSTSLRAQDRTRHESQTLSRPVYAAVPKPRRQVSESAVPSNSLRDSRPSSIAGQSPVRNSQSLTPPQSSSRPPSVYSSHTLSSMEDGRTTVGKRSSMASISSHKDRNPTRSASHTSLLLPPLPQVVTFPLDMPLLPPNAPFMMQSNPRPRSHHSPSPGPSNLSSSPSRRQPASNASSERLAPPPGSYRHSSPHSPEKSPSPHDRGHTRRPSGDTRRSSAPQPSLSDRDRASLATLSRGRPPLPASSYMLQQQQQTANPWTAPPTQSGRLPTSMSYGAVRSHPSRRQTTIS